MANDDLVLAFTEGRVTRRAFVRQRVDGGMSMPDVLAEADALVPQAPLAPPAPSVPAAPEGASPAPERPSRVPDLVVEFVGDGYLVYHPERDRMHSLNHTAALVLELCDGQTDAAGIAGLLQRGYEMDSSPEAEVRECIEHLYVEGLVR